MIVVKLMGGLGNQMFQYAFGRSLSIEKNISLKLDLSFLENKHQPENFTYRDFNLNIFNAKSEIASKNELTLFHENAIVNPISKRLYNKIVKSIHTPIVFSENGFKFQSPSSIKSKYVYLDGYWQSEKYFINHRPQLINDFVFKNTPNHYYSALIEKVQKSNSVSIHFRRGDYVNSDFHPVCHIRYYKEAIDYITNKLNEDVHLFFVSDDIAWVQQHFEAKENHTFVENSNGEFYDDMRLMSLCKHNIIANSSYSWWGAWLNQYPDKIVIAPKRWFAHKKLQSETQDLIPESWLRI